MEFRIDISGKIPDKGFTHGAKFHSDDVFSTALLRILNPDIQVERGFEVPEDFGGIVYDIGRGKFDHHQEDKEIRDNGIPYAAFGLLWREFGSLVLTEEEVMDFDARFIQPLDESDNTGCDNTLAEVISKFNPTWDGNSDYDGRFWRAVAFAQEILMNEFESIQGLRRANDIVQDTMDSGDGRILVLPCYVPWKKMVIGSSYQFVVYPSNRGGYSVQGVPKSKEDRSLVCDFPKEWWGKTPEQLQQISGMEDFRFCHATGFLASADSQETALQIAHIALKSKKDVSG